jgi:ribosome biogenesis GTPase
MIHGRMPTALGRVVRFDARIVIVDVDGVPRACAQAGKLFESRGPQKNPVAVGDEVEVALGRDPGRIEAVRPRRNWLSRVASSHDPREQVLCANVDQVVVVSSVRQPTFSSARADRILIAARHAEIPALLVVNKADLAAEGELDLLCATYESAGIDALRTSVPAGQGLAELRERLGGRLSFLYGGSGVGKSSLLNALAPALGLRVGAVSSYWDQGRHTTSDSRLVELAPGTRVIDTPGIRRFRPFGIAGAELRHFYPEFARARCRFGDCTHDHEPGCGLADAVEQGLVPPSRAASYLELLEEISGDAGGAGDVDSGAELEP